MLSRCLRATMFLASFIALVELKHISIVIGPKLQDCLFMEKESGDKMVADIQVASGHKINIRIISPKKESMQYHQGIETMRVNHLVRDAGEYAFCFMNSYSYRDSVTVLFEYDLHEVGDTTDSKFKKQIAEEKKAFIKKQMQAFKPRIPEGVQGNRPEIAPIEDKYDNDTLAIIQDGLLSLSLQLDRIDHAIKKKNAQMQLQHYIQMGNKSMVQTFSTLLCILIIFLGCGQVVFLKGFFNGKRTWRFWKYD